MEKKNYITPKGYQQLVNELDQLSRIERPEVTALVQWAASNGDRSENADYIYGKRRLREIDRRIRFLSGRLDDAQVVDPCKTQSDKVQFGATVTTVNQDGVTKVFKIVGVDEIDPLRGKISWVAPMARALNEAHEGDTITLQTPAGLDEITLLEVSYPF